MYKPNYTRKPDWLKIRIRTDSNFNKTSDLIKRQKLNTVCEEARCPNIYECWARKTATIMILGDICTRACKFCSVNTGKPDFVDELEPFRVAEAIKEMGLKHVVITSVDRDDIKDDFGATIWSETIKQIKKIIPECSIEILTPDFQGNKRALEIIFQSNPDIFSHNIECIERISKDVRSQSNWDRSKSVLKASVDYGLVTKTGMMVGLGENDNEVTDTMEEMAKLGVHIFNIGQYLQPTKEHYNVDRFVHPKIFDMYKRKGLEMGFKVVESGPLVRSSYHADQQASQFSMAI